MSSFHADLDLDIIFENLTAQIGARPGYGPILVLGLPSITIWSISLKCSN